MTLVNLLIIMAEYWYCCHCKDGPKVLDNQISCISCGHIFCSACPAVEDTKSMTKPARGERQSVHNTHQNDIGGPESQGPSLATSPTSSHVDDVVYLEPFPRPITNPEPVSAQQLPVDQYLRAPRSYYKKLQDLKSGVYQHSALASFLNSAEPEQHSTFSEAFAGGGLDWNFQVVDSGLVEYSRQPVPNFASSSQPVMIEHLKECHNVILTVCSNIRRVQEQGFIQSQISFVALDGDRSGVAGLVPVPIKDIYALAYLFDRAVDRLKQTNLATSHLELVGATLTRACHRMLLPLHSPILPALFDVLEIFPTDVEHLRCWHDTVRFLDLVVLSYTGAHVDPLLGQMLEEYKHKQLSQGNSNSHFLSGIYVQQQPLKCMGPLLGEGQVWTFSLQPILPQRELYISALADVFADIWGPMWKVLGMRDDLVLHYNVGGGSLVPWNYEESAGHPQLKDDERLVHWMPVSLTLQDVSRSEIENPWHPSGDTLENHDSEKDDSSESEPDDQGEMTDFDIEGHRQWTAYAKGHRYWTAYAKAPPFNGSERLLIGAQKSPKLEWNTCRCSTQKFTHQLKELRRLQFLETSKLFHYVDTRNVNMTAGSHGLTLGANITIKTQIGRSWKKVLLEVWENQPESRHPKTLKSFWGVCVSLCTQNAQRVRMIELLRTDSIRQLLKPFCWSDDRIRDEFYSAVSSTDPFALAAIWEREKPWQEELGRVLLTCMRALCQTGYDDDREEFYALWMSSKSRWPKKVLLNPSEHSWTRLLRDTEDSCATAVVVKECLGITSADNRVQRCRHDGGWSAPSRLETAIVINHEIHGSLSINKRQCQEELEEWRRADHLWRTVWDVSDVRQGHKFWMSSPLGRLSTIEKLSPSHLLLEWDTVKRDKIRQIVGFDPADRPGHWEYTEDGDRPPVRPIPVHVQTNA